MPYVERPKRRPTEMGFLPAEEINRFLAHVPEVWHPFFLTAAMSGVRQGELLAMRWKHLDWDSGQYQVKERLYRGAFDVPKSHSSIRTVDLTPAILSALKTHRAAQNEEKLRRGADYQDTDLIFCGKRGQPISNPNRIRKMFDETIQAAGCPPVRFHDLRHSYASLLICQGASPKYIQKQLGHASIQMTFDIYGHLMPDAGREIVRRLDEQVFGTPFQTVH